MVSVGSTRFKSPLAHRLLAWNPCLGNSLLRAAALSLQIYLIWVKGRKASRLLSVHAAGHSNSLR